MNRHEARLERAPDQLGALVVLRHVADVEGVEERAHVGLDCLHTDKQRLSDLAVRRGPAAALERRTAELHQHAR